MPEPVGPDRKTPEKGGNSDEDAQKVLSEQPISKQRVDFAKPDLNY